MKSTLISLFPNASASTVAANPQLSGTITHSHDKNAVQVKPWRSAISLHGRSMNKTESEFALMLEAQKRSGEILRYEFEGITLRWADMRYTPDFVVFTNAYAPDASGDPAAHWISLIEVKGGHIWDRDIVRFKGARAYWPEFAFEIWQKTKQGWRRKF